MATTTSTGPNIGRDRKPQVQRMKDEVETMLHNPLTLEDLLNGRPADGDAKRRKVTWSSAVESVSRCVAAYHHASVATEQEQCAEIVQRIHDYADLLKHKLQAATNADRLLALLHQFMTNRACNMAMRALLDRALSLACYHLSPLSLLQPYYPLLAAPLTSQPLHTGSPPPSPHTLFTTPQYTLGVLGRGRPPLGKLKRDFLLEWVIRLQPSQLRWPVSRSVEHGWGFSVGRPQRAREAGVSRCSRNLHRGSKTRVRDVAGANDRGPRPECH